MQRILTAFGELSGLWVQPTKSYLIPLSRCFKAHHVAGLPVLATNATTRYMGIQIGTRSLEQAN